ncbi:MAG: chromosomal replication initiator DnaA [Hyphomicrobiales bacterium]
MSGRQLVLGLPHRPALGREDFLVAKPNEKAVSMIDRWPDWPSRALALVGPPGSGKSHLAEAWRQRAGGLTIGAADLSLAQVPSLIAEGALVVEDAPGEGLDERGLFHLLNLTREEGAFVLLTSRLNPPAWTIELPDLVSRLKAVPVISLGLPDDELLRGVIVKLFADRQIAADDALVSYLVARMPRELAAARSLVAEIDQRALEEKSNVTRAFVSRVLARFAAPGSLPEEES